MLIVSKFRDYYDSAVGHSGIDKTIVYDRVIKSSPSYYLERLKDSGELTYWLTNQFHIAYRDDKRSELLFLGFCGKIYVIMLYSKDYNDDVHVYVGEDIILFLHPKPNIKDSRFQAIKNIIDKYHLKTDNSVFVRDNVPYFVEHIAGDKWMLETGLNEGSDKAKMILNPKLSDFDFYKIKDAFSTFQDVQNYISGVIGVNTKPMIVVDDKYKIQQHGFDKWSFRNPDPPKRKQKK